MSVARDDDNSRDCLTDENTASVFAAYVAAIRSDLATARQAAQERREANISRHAAADEQYVRRAGKRADDREARRLVRSLPYGMGGRRPVVDGDSGADAALAHLLSLGLVSSIVRAALSGGEAA